MLVMHLLVYSAWWCHRLPNLNDLTTELEDVVQLISVKEAIVGGSWTFMLFHDLRLLQNAAMIAAAYL